MATTVNMGSRLEILNLTLSDSTDTAIELVNQTNNILIRNRSSGDIYFRVGDGDTEYFTIPAGQSLTVELGARQNVAGYLRAATNGHIAEVLSMFGSGS